MIYFREKNSTFVGRLVEGAAQAEDILSEGRVNAYQKKLVPLYI